MLLLVHFGRVVFVVVVVVVALVVLGLVIVIVLVSLGILVVLLCLVVLRRRRRCWMVVMVEWEGVLCRPFSFLCYLAVLYLVRINRI